jgi:hypothetical protein
MPAVVYAQSVTATWDPSPPSENVTSYDVCIGSSAGSCNVQTAWVPGTQTSFAFAPAGGVMRYVSVRAVNSNGTGPYSSPIGFSIPGLTQVSNQSSQVGVPIPPLALSVSDPDGSALTFTHTGLPVGLSINSVTRQITGTPAAAGVYNVSVFVSDNLETVSRSFTWTVTQTCQRISDLNVDCRGDLIWRDTTTGANAVWYLNGSTYLGWANLPTLPIPANSGWQLSAVADINKDGKTDLIWRHADTGQNVVWYLNGTTYLGWASFLTLADSNWQLVASADINRDGAWDLIWRNRVTGQNVVWYLNGTTLVNSEYLPGVADLNWQLVASADVNQDLAPDLIWRNNVSGQNVIWLMNGATIVATSWLPTVADTNWRMAAALDTNNDGNTELIWRHRLTGANYLWYLNQATFAGDSALPGLSDLKWQIVGAR